MHQQRTASPAAGGYPPRQPLCGDRNDGNGCDGDRGAKPHHERGGDAGPEQPLRQREHQNQNGARTRPDADGQNRAETAPPPTGTGKLRGLGTMRVSAMLVVDMAMLAMLRMLMSGHTVASDSGMRRAAVMVMMFVAAMIARVRSVIMMKCSRVRQDRGNRWRGSAVR